MLNWDSLKLGEFLSSYPTMRLIEFGNEVVVEGEYPIEAELEGYEIIREIYEIKIVFPSGYPRSLPVVIETNGRIPRKSEYHTYKDGSLCLGSEIKLKYILSDFPEAIDFVEKILNPFLYSISYKLKFGLYPFGELAHGEAGLIDDYQELFNVDGKSSVLLTLAALGKKKRIANKLSCPCACGLRLGKCNFRLTLTNWRSLEKLSWYRKHLSIFTPIEKPKSCRRRNRRVKS